jgi:hypothetical protein
MFRVPRLLSSQDVSSLLLYGLGPASGSTLPANPDGSPRWTTAASPDVQGQTLVVGVPATMRDVRAGCHVLDGYGGTSALLGLEPLTEANLQTLRDLYPDIVSLDPLSPRDFPLTRHALDVALDSVEVRREFASLLTHFSRDGLAKRVFQTAGLLQRVTSDLRRLRTQVSLEGATAILDATTAQRQCDDLKREWDFTVKYWHQAVSNALAESDVVKGHYQSEIQTLKASYQDQIDALEADKTRRKTRLADAQTQSRILQSRLDAASTDPWTLTSFLQRNTSVSGNWDRLHELITHWVERTQPPATWDTMLAVTAVDKRRDPIPD